VAVLPFETVRHTGILTISHELTGFAEAGSAQSIRQSLVIEVQ